jgi:hypothetical protein
MTAAWLAVCLTVAVGVAAHAGTPDKFNQRAGRVPSDSAVRAALTKYSLGKDSSLDNRKPFKILSGPTLATGNTFGGGIEQAWLVCAVVNSIRTSPGPSNIEGKSFYLRRNPANEVVVVPIENWKDSSPQCGSDK